jgi:hypothetical protein
MNIANCCTRWFSYILNCSDSIEELHFAALILQAALHFSCLSCQMDNETKMLLQLMIQTSSRHEHWTINKLEQWPNTGFLAISVVLEHTILEHPTQLLHAPQLCCSSMNPLHPRPNILLHFQTCFLSLSFIHVVHVYRFKLKVYTH